MYTVKGYWYCRHHDDAFYMNLPRDLDPFTLNFETICCTSNVSCQLEFIGIRKFDQNGNIIEDTTPPQEYYNRCGGGFFRSFLPGVGEIFLEQYRRSVPIDEMH